MAKQNSAKKSKLIESDEDTDMKVRKLTTSSDEDVTDVDDNDESEDVVEEPTAVKATKGRSGYVTFTALQTVEPAPCVGHFDFTQNGVQNLQQNQSYSAPRDVVMHLIDKKIAVITS